MAAKKQKAGLGSVRPSDYVEGKFKEMAKDKKLTQTQLFEYIFWSYIDKEKDEEKQGAIDYKSEINLISNELSNILKHFKSITVKAQDTVLNVTTNAQQTEKNLATEIDTLNKINLELANRNEELENTNGIFSDVKTELEEKIGQLKEIVEGKDIELNKLSTLNNEKDKLLEQQETTIKSLEKENDNKQKKLDKTDEIISIKDTTIRNLETVNTNLQSTVSNLDNLKKSEIEAIKAKFEAIISSLKGKLESYDELKDKELKNLENRVRTELDAEMKLAIANSTLKLADMTSKYAEAQATIETITADYTKRLNVLVEQHKQELQDLEQSGVNKPATKK